MCMLFASACTCQRVFIALIQLRALLPSQLSWLQRATAISRTWHGFCDETIRLLSSFFKAFRVQLICKAFGSEGMCTWTAFLRFSFAPSLDHGVDVYVFLVGLKKYLLFLVLP